MTARCYANGSYVQGRPGSHVARVALPGDDDKEVDVTCRRRDKVAPRVYCPMDPAGGAIREARVAFMQPCKLDFHSKFWNRELCVGRD